MSDTKYVTAMIFFGGRSMMGAEQHVIYATLDVDEYKAVVKHHMDGTPTPVMVHPHGTMAFSFIPSECVSVHCGPERDKPQL